MGNSKIIKYFENKKYVFANDTLRMECFDV